MNIEKDADGKVTIDTKEVAAKLSFLVGKTIAFRDGYEDATTTTQVVGVRAENTPGLAGYPQVSIYTHVGIQTITKSKHFGDIMILEHDGSLVSLGSYTEAMGICF